MMGIGLIGLLLPVYLRDCNPKIERLEDWARSAD